MTRANEEPGDRPPSGGASLRTAAAGSGAVDASTGAAETAVAVAETGVGARAGGTDAAIPAGDLRAGTARDRAKGARRAALLAAAARLFAERGFDGVTLGDIGEAAGVSGPAVYRHVSGKQALLGAILVDVSERLLRGGREVSAAHVFADPTAHAPSDEPDTAEIRTTAPPLPHTSTDRPVDLTAHTPSDEPEIPPLTAAVRTTAGPDGELRALVDFHVAFALAEADVIRVQDRDLDRLSAADRSTVRDLQNAYVAVWTDALARATASTETLSTETVSTKTGSTKTGSTKTASIETAAERRVRALACFGLINSTPHSVRGVPASQVRLTLTRMAFAALTA